MAGLVARAADVAGEEELLLAAGRGGAGGGWCGGRVGVLPCWNRRDFPASGPLPDSQVTLYFHSGENLIVVESNENRGVWEGLFDVFH